MESYNLFGDDGSGMLEGLTEIGGADGFSGNPSTNVTNENKDVTENSYRQSYQPGLTQDGAVQKLPSFSSAGGASAVPSGGPGQGANAGGPTGPDYHDYGAYPPRPRMPQQPPHGPMHPTHHGHPSHYPGYHPGPDPMYGMPEHPGIADMGVWSGPAATNRYTPMAPGYRHSYEHQQKMHQYPPQQGPGIGGMQSQNGSYLPRQPHFPQPTQAVYSQQQGYPSYTQMHPPPASRIPQHTSYHQQMEVNPHQYGIPHPQQSHSSIGQHQPHQSMASHQGNVGPSIQGGHSNIHLHHSAAATHHHGARPLTPSSVAGHPAASQIAYPPHHTVPMNYQGHQVQHPLDVNVTNQYSSPKPTGLESPQYRSQFHQISPQVSPRAQISPRQAVPAQASPRPVMSPVKGAGVSPLGPRVPAPQPQPAAPPPSQAPPPQAPQPQHPSHAPQPPVYQSQNTLQALEQMVLPAGSEYPYQRNPASPAVGHVLTSMPWNQPKVTPAAPATTAIMENCDQNSKVPETLGPSSLNMENMKTSQPTANIDTNDSQLNEKERTKLSHLAEKNESNTSYLQSVDGNSKDLSSDPSMNSLSNTVLAEYSDSNVSKPQQSFSNDKITNENTEDKKVPASEQISKNLDSVEKAPNQTCQPIKANEQVQNSNTPHHFETIPMLMSRNPVYSNSPMHGNIPPSSSQTNFPSMPPNSMPSSQQLSHSAGNTSLPEPAPHVNIANVLQPPITNQQIGINRLPDMNSMQSNLQTPVPPLQNINSLSLPNSGVAMGSVAPNIPNNQPNAMTNLPHGVSSSIQNSPSNILTNISHPANPNMNLMGSNILPLPGMYNAAQHHQERAALQQQIQEIYCLPPSPENQEKVRRLQERLALLQQHETVDKCSGGPNCLLQNSIYSQKMVESPQVSSTTGRGRGKGPARPRKPRAKKEKLSGPPNVASLDQLPVSEDCVTPGTGLSSHTELDLTEEVSNLDDSALSIDDSQSNEKVKKPRGPRKTKERKPRIPKEIKDVAADGEKPIKERKKREPKDPNAPKRKRNSKKDITEIHADTTTNYDGLEKSTSDNTSLDNSKLDSSNAIVQNVNENSVTDFDDIPVSKIAIKDLLEEAEAKREEQDRDDDDSVFSPSNKRRSSKKRGPCSASKRASQKKIPTGKKRKRGGLVPDSDGEPDDLMATPPPSPTQEGECDSLKRRSGRHTQRKKYTDDVLIRLSDEEYPVGSAPKRESNEIKSDEVSLDFKEVKADTTPKPNYIYVNTTDEDAMIVQHVLASRMGKREIKVDTDIKDKDPVPGEENKDTIPEKTEEDTTHNDDDIQKKEEISTENNIEAVEQETIIPKVEIKVDVDEEKKDSDTIEVEPKAVAVEINDKSTDDVNKTVIVDVEEFYVKYRNFSYLHCEWKTEEELYKGDKRIYSKIKRFKQKQSQQMNIFELLDEEPFNPDYIEVERILDVSENVDPANKSVVKHYLVKWKSLQYEESTWELEEDIDIDKIKQFRTFDEIPPKDKWKYKKRPPAESWVQLKESPLYKGGNTLRPYQLEGLNWLLFSWHNGRNCILADEMGLGKTIQSLTFVNSVWECGIRGPFLIIAPLSTIPNWQREFESWTDMNVVVYHGSQQSKSMIQEYEFFYKNDKGEPIKEITKFNVLITTFEIIVTDFQELKSFNWRICVIDEAHRLKNRNCKLLEGLRQLHMEHRVLLSGTPLQNNVNELFSLLNFLEPSQFSSNEVFLNEFGQLKTESEVKKLQALLKPMMLRRLKEDVEKSLGPKEETIIEVELTNIQKKYYRAILERNFSFLQKGVTSAANIPNLMNTMMELRKCCIHPYLLNGAEDQIQFDYKQANGEDKEAYYKALIQSSGKMVLVDKLLPKLKAGGHRVLIFSQMVRCLDILEDYLLFRKYPYERIDGRIRGNLRQEAIDRFSKPDSDRFVFLLCTKAGGLGINLTAADTVIIYDSDWNPQNDLQAQARCHRIGQQKMVKIYRLVCRNSYEREMFDKASLKLGLDKAILQSMNTTQGNEKTGVKQLSKKEIEDLLKKGAYGAVMDEDNAGDKFCEEDIEMILARRTQIIQMESEKGSTFSKASFAAADQRSDIDIRDPDFWNKWAKKAEIDTTEKKEDEDLIVTEPRKRTVIKRYGHDDGTMEMSDMEVTPDSEDDEDGISLRSKRKKDKLGRKSRRYGSDDYIPRHEGVPIDEEVVYGSWTRSECFKIERGLLTFGWARWEEIVEKNQFRQGWTIPVIEDCARIIVLYCLRHYKGDEKIRNFIWDLIEPCENGEVTIARNHSGLHNPVPRGRNAKKKNKVRDVPKPSDTQKWQDSNHWSSADKYDCDAYLESSYKKHLLRHANKVLLRVRMMYYIKHEVIGDFATQIENGAHASTLGMRVPRGVDSAPPRLWWDAECDVSLLVGSYVHGYENYLEMRSDPQLCFVDKLGPPDDAECTDIKREERKVRGSGVGDEDCTDDVSSGAGATSPPASPRADDDPADPADPDPANPAHPWPSMQDLNTRLRRIITAYQRNYKREELKLQQRAKMERRERMEHYARDEISQWRWSRADEEAFRRTVASYGVEFDPTTKSLRWGRFRALARLDSKSDDALTDYLKAFMAMCKRQCGLSVGEAELPTRADLKAEPIGEERAIATLERIDLLRVLREEVAPHAALDARLALCERAPDAPPWWQPAKHDKLLVLGVSKHGLGDTYNKLFCDPKLPFADCARKFYNIKSKRKVDKKSSDEEDDAKNDSEDSSSGPRMSLRRSTRSSTVGERDADDKDALSELETLAKLGRNEDSLPPNHWFSERALETRLHHIAHAVQNCEWPSADLQKASEAGRPHERRPHHKRHIAIDVETERAKLHALLSSPRALHASPRDRDDASSDSSRRSTPAPPPAHQRAAPPPSPAPAPAPPSAAAAAAAPVDLSAPLDLSDSAAPKSKLDDTLSRLMKRKNVPAPEQIVGKEKKRKKLDEIVLGLSAAKTSSAGSGAGGGGTGAGGDARLRGTPVLPNVSVTPVPPPSSSPAASSQKPFSVTVTNVPSPNATPKELSSFLQQSLEQSSLLKGQKASSSQVKSFSHEAKVNKWLAEQAIVESRRRGGGGGGGGGGSGGGGAASGAGAGAAAAPRLAPDEHVPVVHRVTGKRIAGNKAPQLKHLAQWIAENPMYDIDTKWTESIKEHVKLPHDVRSARHAPHAPHAPHAQHAPAGAAMGERKKGRPPSLDSSSANVLSSSAHLNQSLAGLNPALLASLSAFDPKTLASTLSSLTGFDPKLLSSFDPKLLASLSSFDPKNNPLLSSFSGMPNLLGGNLFANLAGLGLPGFSSLDMNSLGAPGGSTDTKNKSRKPAEQSSSAKGSNSQFPFVFPNPNMLYPQLGLSGMNPFGMHSGMSSAYDAFGLLSSSLAASSATSTSHSSTHTTSRSSAKSSTTTKASTVASGASHSRQQKSASSGQHSAQLSQILLPPDTYLLESLSKQHYDALMKSDKRAGNDGHEATDLSKVEKKKSHAYDTLRSQIPPEFAAVQEKLLKGDKKDIDISKMLLEQMASGALSASLVSAAEGKKKDADNKELTESIDYSNRPLNLDAVQAAAASLKRSHDEMVNEPENLTMTQTGHANKRSKDREYCNSDIKNTPTNTGEMDLEDLIAPSTVIKTGMKPSELDNNKMVGDVIKEDAHSNRLFISNDDANKLNPSGGAGRADAESNNDDKFDESSLDSSRNKMKDIKSSEEGAAAGTASRRELRSSSLRQSIDQ